MRIYPHSPDGDERVAQLVEQLTFNQRVQGSNPCALTISDIFLKKPADWPPQPHGYGG